MHGCGRIFSVTGNWGAVRLASCLVNRGRGNRQWFVPVVLASPDVGRGCASGAANVFGEQFSVVAAGLCFGAAFVALIGDKGTDYCPRAFRSASSLGCAVALSGICLARSDGRR